MKNNGEKQTNNRPEIKVIMIIMNWCNACFLKIQY